MASKEDETEDEKKERGKEVIERLHKLLKPFILRRRKAEVEKGIPPKTEIKVYVRMSRKQNNWYKRILEKDLSVINSGKVDNLDVVKPYKQVTDPKRAYKIFSCNSEKFAITRTSSLVLREVLHGKKANT